jgi:hypothetical protein
MEDVVVRMRAKTPEGALAKLQYILKGDDFDEDEGEVKCGTMMSMPLSAMRDALAMLR